MMASVKHFRTRRTSHTVRRSHATRQRHDWSSEELRDLRQFLQDHEHLSWKMKAKVWHQKHGVKRTGESLRGKQNYLDRLAKSVDIDYQRSPSGSGTVHSSESFEGSGSARLEIEPTSTAGQTKISKCRQARQIRLRRPSEYELADSGRPALPSIASIDHFTTSASALRDAGFEALLDSLIERWNNDLGYDGRKHLKY